MPSTASKCHDYLFPFLFHRHMILKQKYPRTPPAVFKIKSSMSQQPTLVQSCMISTIKLTLKLASVTFNRLRIRYAKNGRNAPKGTKAMTFPARFNTTGNIPIIL